jgi:cell division protein FtsQ
VSVSTSLPDRAAERGRTRRRGRLRVALGVLLAAGTLVGAGWLVLGSGALGVETVRVTGVERLDAGEVASRAGITPGTPLARLDTDAVVRRLSALPAVRGVSVHRRWPRTVEIAVRERVPAAVQPQGSGWALLDATGVEFAVERRRPADLPVVTTGSTAGRAGLRAGLEVVRSLPPVVREKVRSVHVASTEKVTLRMTRGRSVVWGSTERGERKADVLAVLLSRKAKVAVYDVSAPDTPTTTRR